MRVNRLLSILLIISNKGIVTGQELADHFEVSLRTIYRDIDKICEAGIPIASNGGKGGGFYIMENYNLNNLFLDKNELQALMPLIDNFKFLFGKNQQFNDVALKLENICDKDKDVNNSLSINMSHFTMEEELKEYLFFISKAIEDNKLLEFNYINRRMEYSRRVVEPMKITFSRGEWYLIGFCQNRNHYRKFKLLRVRNIKLGDEFNKRLITDEELEKELKGEYNIKSIKVVLKFSSRIKEHLIEHFSKDKINTTEDGSLIVEEHYPHEEGLIKFILSFGQDCEVLEPGYLICEIREYLKEMVKKYNAP